MCSAKKRAIIGFRPGNSRVTGRALVSAVAVEHIFAIQAQRAGTLIVRGIGLVRARSKIGLRNLAFNLDRYGTLKRV